MRNHQVPSIVLTFIILLSACMPEPSVRERIRSIGDYIVYYGEGRADDLIRFDLAIIQPETLDEKGLLELKRHGTLAVAYLSVGEAEPGRPWYTDGRVDPRWLLGKNENWGSYFVDARQTGWQKLMLDLTGEFIENGFDGVFLDTVDTVDVYPETRGGMIALIKSLRAAYPEVLMIQNRGFNVVETVASDLDGIMFEDLSTTYNFDSHEYIYIDSSAAAQQMVELHEHTGLPILALDYAPPDNPGMAYRAFQIARRFNFIPAISVIELDDIPDYHLDEGGAADLRIREIWAEGDGDRVTLIARLENVGLADAAGVDVALSVDGQPISTMQKDFSIGESYNWVVDWSEPKENALVAVTLDFKDKTPDDNRMEWDFTAAALSIEPLVPPGQQRRRPSGNGPDMLAMYFDSPLVVDGELLEWSDLPCTDVDRSDQISCGDPVRWSGPGDLSGRVCYGWDEDNLYLAFTIHDDIIVQKYTAGNLWQGDHVEFWFDTQLQLDFDSAAAGDDDFQIGISPGNFADVPPDFFIFTPPVSQERYRPIVQFAVIRTGTGYAGEAMIPIKVLKGLRLALDHAIGASFEPSDTDTPGSSEQELMMSSAPKSSSDWGNPLNWVNLIIK